MLTALLVDVISERDKEQTNKLILLKCKSDPMSLQDNNWTGVLLGKLVLLITQSDFSTGAKVEKRRESAFVSTN